MNREGCWSGWILRIALESYGVQREAEKVREREEKNFSPRKGCRYVYSLLDTAPRSILSCFGTILTLNPSALEPLAESVTVIKVGAKRAFRNIYRYIYAAARKSIRYSSVSYRIWLCLSIFIYEADRRYRCETRSVRNGRYQITVGEILFRVKREMPWIR